MFDGRLRSPDGQKLFSRRSPGNSGDPSRRKMASAPVRRMTVTALQRPSNRRRKRGASTVLDAVKLVTTVPRLHVFFE